MKEWLDRDKQKEKILNWVDSDSPLFLLTVKDPVELGDIVIWLEEIPGKTLSIAYLNTDSEVTKFGLLEHIVTELGAENFPKFTAKQDSYSNIEPKIIIRQQMGNRITSESDININDNEQSININSFDQSSLYLNYFESKINDFLYLFLLELPDLCEENDVIIVCRFKGSGFYNLDAKFKAWFQDHFLRRIKKVRTKTIVICEANSGNLSETFDHQYQFRIDDLKYGDILGVAKKYFNDEEGLFCKGAVDQFDKIEYNIFKFKLQRNIVINQ
jgi:hypothetical protein